MAVVIVIVLFLLLVVVVKALLPLLRCSEMIEESEVGCIRFRLMDLILKFVQTA